MQVHVDTVLLLLQARNGFLHVVRDAVGGNVRLALLPVVLLRLRDEGLLERVLVHVEVGPVGVALVEAQGDKALDALLDEVRVDALAVPLALNEAQHRVGALLLALQVHKEDVLPLDQRERVDLVDILAPFVLFPLDPVCACVLEGRDQ